MLRWPRGLKRLGRWVVSRPLSATLVLVVVLWSLSVLNLLAVYRAPQHRRSEQLKAEIIHLSEEYVRALAHENGNMVDGPYAGRFTAYDLKKTMAVLLESVLQRLGRLERTVDGIMNGTLFNGTLNITTDGKPILQAKDVIAGVSEECELASEDEERYPHCKEKVLWMAQMWKSDPCYASYGVDGSRCSFIMYLSEVEGWCPKKAWRGSHVISLKEGPVIKAEPQRDLEGLMRLLRDPNERQGYAWIRMRITRMWDKWLGALERLNAKQDLSTRNKKKILIHLGLLSKQSGWKFAEMQFKGGPLGELVQWSDLITTLYLLGHELTITSEVEQLVSILSKLPDVKSPCQSRKELPVQLIYTDIVGHIQFKKRVKNGYGKFRCMFRILDSFGTEPAYNFRSFAKQNKILTSWGGQDLQPKQFFTMFPHSPDNSFMGFVVEQHLNDSQVREIQRLNQALVYGKNEYMWKGKEEYLATVQDYLAIHGTVYTDKGASTLPDFVHNHGLLTGVELHKVLSQSKVFLGLGFPYEGPAPLEAIANGAVFINPKLQPPHSSRNTAFFKGKPTQRELTSQHPYAENFIGEPHVYTIDITNMNEVKATIEKILAQNTFEPYLPFEFTEEGMLQRMNAFLENQDFCEFQKSTPKWPPSSAVQMTLGEPGLSCKDVCWKLDRICEPSHFADLNTVQALMQAGAECQELKPAAANIYYPGVDSDQRCLLQAEDLLFSCVGNRSDLSRLCPCRDYIPGQTALCKGCEG